MLKPRIESKTRSSSITLIGIAQISKRKRMIEVIEISKNTGMVGELIIKQVLLT